MGQRTNYFLLFIKGMAMGGADLVPGVSGGTIALISGIYDELLKSINALTISNLKLLQTSGITRFWKQINGWFLLTVFGGIATSIVSLSHFLHWLFENEPIALWSFFFGLLLASIIFLIKRVEAWNSITIMHFVVGAIISFFLTTLTGTPKEAGHAYLFLCGFIGISAMILPGLSGAYILLVLGVYETIISLVRRAIELFVSFNTMEFFEVFSKLGAFALGIAIGLRLFAKLLHQMLKKYPNRTMATLVGLIFGALHKVWPWQDQVNNTGSILPYNYSNNPEILKAILFSLFGFAVLLLLERINLKNNG